jgi:hypothetical protein
MVPSHVSTRDRKFRESTEEDNSRHGLVVVHLPSLYYGALYRCTVRNGRSTERVLQDGTVRCVCTWLGPFHPLIHLSHSFVGTRIPRQ